MTFTGAGLATTTAFLVALATIVANTLFASATVLLQLQWHGAFGAIFHKSKLINKLRLLYQNRKKWTSRDRAVPCPLYPYN